jgi:hypothetical protein
VAMVMIAAMAIQRSGLIGCYLTTDVKSRLGTQTLQQRYGALASDKRPVPALAGPNILIAVDLSGPLPCSLIGADLCPIVPITGSPRFIESKLPRCPRELKTAPELIEDQIFISPPTLIGVGESCTVDGEVTSTLRLAHIPIIHETSPMSAKGLYSVSYVDATAYSPPAISLGTT